MYLHLGGDVSVRTEEILMICDLDNASCSKITRDFLARAEKEGRVVNPGEELPKAFVVCRKPGGRDMVYLSQLNSSTLLRRAENPPA
jgi:hypothetical protein